MKRNYLDYLTLKGLLQTTSNTLQTQLGLSAGQAVGTTGTVRNLLSRASKVLQGLFAGSESELETYGFAVVVGTASVPVPATWRSYVAYKREWDLKTQRRKDAETGAWSHSARAISFTHWVSGP